MAKDPKRFWAGMHFSAEVSHLSQLSRYKSSLGQVGNRINLNLRKVVPLFTSHRGSLEFLKSNAKSHLQQKFFFCNSRSEKFAQSAARLHCGGQPSRGRTSAVHFVVGTFVSSQGSGKKRVGRKRRRDPAATRDHRRSRTS